MTRLATPPVGRASADSFVAFEGKRGSRNRFAADRFLGALMRRPCLHRRLGRWGPPASLVLCSSRHLTRNARRAEVAFPRALSGSSGIRTEVRHGRLGGGILRVARYPLREELRLMAGAKSGDRDDKVANGEAHQATLRLCSRTVCSIVLNPSSDTGRIARRQGRCCLSARGAHVVFRLQQAA